jgi:hypothetical protein
MVNKSSVLLIFINLHPQCLKYKCSEGEERSDHSGHNRRGITGGCTSLTSGSGSRSGSGSVSGPSELDAYCLIERSANKGDETSFSIGHNSAVASSRGANGIVKVSTTLKFNKI